MNAVRRLARVAIALALGTTGLAAGAPPAHTATADDPVIRTFGVYPGRSEAELRSFEEAIGYPIDVIVQFGGAEGPHDLTGSIWGQMQRWAERLGHRDPLYSVTIPLAFGHADAESAAGRQRIAADLEATAAGASDVAYGTVADYLIGAGLGDAVLRLGHEFDGGWMPWSARATCDGYVAAYRHVAELMRARSADFRFEWAGTVRHLADWADCAYPGDDVVDIVGLSVYDQGGPMRHFSVSDGTWNDPDLVWAQQFVPGLEFHHEFATAHDKPVSYAEWGLVASAPGAHGGDNPTFVRSMVAWLRALPTEGPGALLYHAYFLGVQNYDVRRLEQSAAVFFDEFGR